RFHWLFFGNVGQRAAGAAGRPDASWLPQSTAIPSVAAAAASANGLPDMRAGYRALVGPAFRLENVSIFGSTPFLGGARRFGAVAAVAEVSPGFGWRIQTDQGNATALHPFDDARLILNMSVWESIEALRAFVYSTPAHLTVMKRRREWFERMEVYLALWWMPA